MFTPTPEAAFGKGGILRFRFRKTGRHITALTLEQMCLLFYLKRASVLGTLVSSENSLFIQLWKRKKKNISAFVNIKFLSLNFFSETK